MRGEITGPFTLFFEQTGLQHRLCCETKNSSTGAMTLSMNHSVPPLPFPYILFFCNFLKGKYLLDGNAMLTEWLDLKLAKVGHLLATILFNK